jgi:hypothetical protein
MMAVQSEAAEKIEKLALATDTHIGIMDGFGVAVWSFSYAVLGLEILHLFVLDVLGKNSAAAKIFATKSSTE